MIVIAAAITVVTPAVAQGDAPTMGRSIKALAKVPLKSHDGAALQLGARIAKGKPTLIAFWASWCGPCIAEAPYLNRIRREVGGSVNFLYINRRDGDSDRDQPATDISRFLKRAGMTDVDYLVADVPAYRRIIGADAQNIPQGLVGIPRIYLFDKSGRQVFTSLGFTPSDAAELERRVKEAVAG